MLISFDTRLTNKGPYDGLMINDRGPHIPSVIIESSRYHYFAAF